jgi:hypothetical protein
LPPRRSFGLALFVLLAAAAACIPFKDDPAGDSGRSESNSVSLGDAASPVPLATPDANPGEAGARSSCDLRKPFGAPTFVEGLADPSALLVAGLRLSADYRTGYYHANPLDGSGSSAVSLDLYVVTRVDPAAPFDGTLSVMGAGINTTADETDPTVSGNGLLLVFARAYTQQPAHLYYATRDTTSASFVYAGPVPNVNDFTGATSDSTPFLREDGKVLYFNSSRASASGSSIYRSTWTGSAFGVPVPVAELSSPVGGYGPVVTPDDLTIYFGVPRGVPGAPDDAVGDIWMSSRARTSDPFSPPVNVAELNSSLMKAPTFVTRDGCTLYSSAFATAPAADGTATEYVAEKPGP